MKTMTIDEVRKLIEKHAPFLALPEDPPFKRGQADLASKLLEELQPDEEAPATYRAGFQDLFDRAVKECTWSSSRKYADMLGQTLTFANIEAYRKEVIFDLYWALEMRRSSDNPEIEKADRENLLRWMERKYDKSK